MVIFLKLHFFFILIKWYLSLDWHGKLHEFEDNNTVWKCPIHFLIPYACTFSAFNIWLAITIINQGLHGLIKIYIYLPLIWLHGMTKFHSMYNYKNILTQMVIIKSCTILTNCCIRTVTLQIIINQLLHTVFFINQTSSWNHMKLVICELRCRLHLSLTDEKVSSEGKFYNFIIIITMLKWINLSIRMQWNCQWSEIKKQSYFWVMFYATYSQWRMTNIGDICAQNQIRGEDFSSLITKTLYFCKTWSRTICLGHRYGIYNVNSFYRKNLPCHLQENKI